MEKPDLIGGMLAGIQRIARVVGQTLASLALLFPSAARADDCVLWNLSGRFEIVQSNGFFVGFVLSQTSNGFLQGTAGVGSIGGTVSGQFTSVDEFEMTVNWNNGSVGVYTGSITPNFSNGVIQGGSISGETVDQAHRQFRANWSDRVPGGPGDGVARCTLTQDQLIRAGRARLRRLFQ